MTMMPASAPETSPPSPSSYIGNIDFNTPSLSSVSASSASTPRVAHHHQPYAVAGTVANTASESRQAAQAGPRSTSSAAAANDNTSTSVTSADPTVGRNATTSNNAAILNAAGQVVTAGATKIVGWTFDNMNILDTSTSKSGLRPMHVRVSVRVHHVAFLHPGLDNGGRTKIMHGDRFGKWKFISKKNKVAPPGLLRFGSKKGDWTNPKHYPHIPSFGGSSYGMDDLVGSSGRNLAAMKIWNDDDVMDDVTKDTTEIAEIISAEAFRLSRDGIIQHHYALNHALSQPSFPTSVRMGAHSDHHIQKNTQDEARYYKELAERPKGYRRLVVSSAWNACDLVVPTNPNVASNIVLSTGANSPRTLFRTTSSNLERRASSDSLGAEQNEKDPSREEKKDETLFDNVEYQYVGPPMTAEFFQLLRHHGAATFGRHLPEVSCMVPNNAILFEVRQSKSKKKRKAATQPFVVEAPHVIWGDARDKMLSRIAKEGCPFIDSRKFEYVSNERLHDAGFTESLMVAGSTLWVKNARDDDGDTTSISSNSSRSSTNSKRILQAKYYGGKMVDGMKEGVVMGAKGTAKTHNETWKVAEKGTKHVANRAKDVVDGAKELGKVVASKLPSIPDNRELTAPLTSHSRSVGQKTKKSKMKSLRNKIRRLKKSDDNESLADESMSTDNATANQQTDAHSVQNISPKKSVDELFVRPVHYELLTDDIIEIRIVSFPNKDDVIASFPISVASVMTQRSAGERVNDPLKPSELTVTLVQEPSAPLMRWGVELKVTLRAVEVKPRLSRKMPRPMPVIADKIPCVEDNHELSGMATQKIVKDSQTTEDQLLKKDMPAIEKQIIEDDLEATEEQHIKEENELNDAIITYGYKLGENDDAVAPKEIRLRQMFYCEREHGAIARKMERKSVLSDDEREMIKDARADPSILKKDNIGKEHLTQLEQLCRKMPGIENVDTMDEPASLHTAAAPGVNLNSLEKVSWTMAKSLDLCFGEVMGCSARYAVQSRLLQNLSAKSRPRVTRSEARAWCSQVAGKLSACAINENINNATLKSSIDMILSIILDSVHEPRMGLKENVSEEMKLDEDEIAMSETIRAGNIWFELDSKDLVEWVAAVTSQLLECAEELGDDQAVSALNELEGQEIASTATDSDKQIDQASANLFIPAPTEQKRFISPDEVSELAVRIYSGEKNQRKNAISTLQNALPGSSNRRKSKTGPSSEILNKYHSQQANMQPSSLVITLAYLTCLFIVFLCAIGAVVLVTYYPGLSTSN